MSAAKNRWTGEWSEERTARVWAGISSRLPARAEAAPRRRAWVLLAAAVAVGAALSLYFVSSAGVSPKTGASLVTQSDSLSVVLAEGSGLRISPVSRVHLRQLSDERVGIELEEGSIVCDVKRNPGRVFSVRAGDVEVRVLGTKFSVSRQVRAGHSRIEVRVERGQVEVLKGSGRADVHRLEAGQNWASEETFGKLAPSAAPSAVLPSEAAVPSEPRVERAPSSGSSAPSEGADAPPTDARALLEAASSARRDGQLRRAGELYQRIVELHGNDPRAGLAAFELGRLRMDALGEPGAAIQALHRAIELSPSAGFREDAMARLPRARARLGQVAECRVAKQAYLDRYPAGLHRLEVVRLCP